MVNYTSSTYRHMPWVCLQSSSWEASRSSLKENFLRLQHRHCHTAHPQPCLMFSFGHTEGIGGISSWTAHACSRCARSNILKSQGRKAPFFWFNEVKHSTSLRRNYTIFHGTQEQALGGHKFQMHKTPKRVGRVSQESCCSLFSVAHRFTVRWASYCSYLPM